MKIKREEPEPVFFFHSSVTDSTFSQGLDASILKGIYKIFAKKYFWFATILI